ncbi:hypothetical protein [Fulvivirga lutimaris]|uniref:hypothetical protein n=1 Tax=Fulvivirga lutimaris TaxID=1819566 RepID=UPI001C8803E2|nr:hypothetical protein [Fulvivirga lutimaris]
MSSLFQTHAIGKHILPITKHWAIELNDYCNDLRKSAISVTEWQSQIESLFDSIPLDDLLKFIDFEQLVKSFDYPDLGVNTRKVTFPKLDGLPERTAFVKKIFGMKKDRAIIPHGHANMSSAHLVLKGEMRLRHYDNLGVEDYSMLIKPTIDKTIGIGESSSISDEKDNVHWFIAESETAFTFDIIILDLDDKPYNIYNLDIYAKENQHDGNFRVPILDVDTALKKYGKESHH